VKHCGEDLLQDLINFGLGYMAQTRLPVKRGTFVEFRNGMINFCPIGRSCSQAERDQFATFDEAHGVRKNFVSALREKFPAHLGLEFAIGEYSSSCS
jgi:phosphomannomutase